MSQTPYQILIGDVTDRLRVLADKSIHCIVTSPPYWSLRDYGVEGQIGLEATPDAYLHRMVNVFRAVHRVLRDDGTLWLNMGDSYAGGRHGGNPTRDSSTLEGSRRNQEASIVKRSIDTTTSRRRDREPIPRSDRRIDNIKPKDLVGMPWRLALMLQADGWHLRRDIIWAKPSPMPESVIDRPTTAHEYIFLLTKKARYYYDGFAIRERCNSGASDVRKMLEQAPRIGGKHKDLDDPLNMANGHTRVGRQRSVGDPSSRNARSVWTIASEPYAEAHFATFPTELARRCIAAGTSEKGCCPSCGKPWTRVLKKRRWRVAYHDHKNDRAEGMSQAKPNSLNGRDYYNEVEPRATIGWRPGCGCTCPIPVPCVVLDPFLGSGTTAAAACTMGRRAIGIELNPVYARLAERRIRKALQPQAYQDLDAITDAPLFCP